MNKLLIVIVFSVFFSLVIVPSYALTFPSFSTESIGVKAAVLIHPTRLALTGFGVSPGIFEIMNILGKEVVLRRLLSANEKFPL